MPSKKSVDAPESKYRFLAILGSIGLAVLGLFLAFSIGSYYINPWGIFAAAGSFFVYSYGILAFLIPIYLIFAAYILGDPVYRPERIFILGGVILPFFTLALGFYWIREFENVRGGFPLLDRLGKPGIGFSLFIFTALEVAAIVLLYNILFLRKKADSSMEEPLDETRVEPHQNLNREEFTHGAYTKNQPELEPVESRPAKAPQSSAQGLAQGPAQNQAKTLRDIYAETAAAVSAEEVDAGVSVVETEPFLAKSLRFLVIQGQTSSKEFDAAKELDEADFAAEAGDEGQTSVKAFDAAKELDEADFAAEAGDEGQTSSNAAEAGDEGDEEHASVKAFDEPGFTEEEYEGHTPYPSSDEDVEKALADAEEHAAEEAARHEGQTPKNQHLTWQMQAKKADRTRGQTYSVPVEGILKQYPDGEYWIIDEDTRDAALTLKETFKEFNIQVEVTGIRKGPVITMFEILPAPGIRLNRIENLADNIAMRLAAESVRIVAPIPGKHAVGIEVPNARRNIVSFREIIEGEINSRDEKKAGGKVAEVPVVLGKDITGEAVTVDLVQMPHLLIAGATGSGKSVCVNAMILSILYRKPPAECRLILIDPKIVELKLYNDIPHLLTPVITEPKKAFQALQYCICEMERRYACLDSIGVRDIRSYNRRIKEREIAAEFMPYIVVVIDEFADLTATTGKELEQIVARLAAMSRAVGIHLVLATQRPSIDVITGLIKANIPSRIAFMVASRSNSQIIIDSPGAEKLLGKGDMLYSGAIDPFPIRMQGAFVSEEEVDRVVDYVKTLGEPDYIDDEIFYDDDEENPDQSFLFEGEDPLYENALEILKQQGTISASFIQRRLKVGYNRAARIVEEMEKRGVVGPAQGSKPRELLRGVM